LPSAWRLTLGKARKFAISTQLCRVPGARHSAKRPYFKFSTSFAECQSGGTWQRPLCRVLHSAKLPKIVFFCFSFHQYKREQSHIYITSITYKPHSAPHITIHHIYHFHHHIYHK
jgi:hypothetical protein